MSQFVPRYYEIEQSLRVRIAALNPDNPLPSDAQLCEEFGVSRMTARSAVQRLVQEGLVYRVPGKGTFVADTGAHRRRRLRRRAGGRQRVTVLDRIGSLDQVALATRHPAIDVHVHEGISLRIHPGRGLDIGAAWYRGLNLSWISSAGEGGTDSTDWSAAWGGGLVTTCGLDNVGAPSEGIGLHGTYTFLAAEEIEIDRNADRVSCRATISDPRGLRVDRSIRTSVGEGRIELSDATVNRAEEPLEAPVLYHVNLGWPLWDAAARVESDAREIVPRDAHASGRDWSAAPDPEPAPERVWEHAGATRTAVINDLLGLRVAVESSLPRLWQWVDPTPGFYALALEPANCSVLGRAHDRAEGRLPLLAPGEERTTSLVITAEVGP